MWFHTTAPLWFHTTDTTKTTNTKEYVFVQSLRTMNCALCTLYALPLCVKQIKKPLHLRSGFVNWLGLEPRTHTLKVYCSTN
jgi:hypothetical protein